MFKIKVIHYYYQGTFYAPGNGYIKDHFGDVLTFRTRKDALEYLEREVGKIILVKGKSTYKQAGRYYLSHGEYERPDFVIVETKAKSRRY